MTKTLDTALTAAAEALDRGETVDLDQILNGLGAADLRTLAVDGLNHIMGRIEAANTALDAFHGRIWELIPGGRPDGEPIDGWSNYLPTGLPPFHKRELDRLMRAWTDATSGTRIVAPTSRAA